MVAYEMPSPQRDSQLARLCDEQRSGGAVGRRLHCGQAQPGISHSCALQLQPRLNAMVLQPSQQRGSGIAQACDRGRVGWTAVRGGSGGGSGGGEAVSRLAGGGDCNVSQDNLHI